MKTILLMVALLQGSALSPCQRVETQRPQREGPLSLRKVCQIERRMERLQPGMSSVQVFRALGIYRERRRILARSGGFRTTYTLRFEGSYSLTLYWAPDSWQGGTGSLRRAELSSRGEIIRIVEWWAQPNNRLQTDAAIGFLSSVFPAVEAMSFARRG